MGDRLTGRVDVPDHPASWLGHRKFMKILGESKRSRLYTLKYLDFFILTCGKVWFFIDSWYIIHTIIKTDIVVIVVYIYIHTYRDFASCSWRYMLFVVSTLPPITLEKSLGSIYFQSFEGVLEDQLCRLRMPRKIIISCLESLNGVATRHCQFVRSPICWSSFPFFKDLRMDGCFFFVFVVAACHRVLLKISSTFFYRTTREPSWHQKIQKMRESV